MIDKNTAVEVFKYFLDQVNEAGLPLVLLRPREISEATSYTGDYDFFIPQKSTDTLLTIMHKVAIETCSSFSVSRRQYGKIDITLYSRLDNQSIALEIWNLLTVKDPLHKTVRYISSDVLEPLLIRNETSVFSFPIDIEALYYLSHLYSVKKKLSTPLVEERLQYYLSELQASGSIYFDIVEALVNGEIDIKTAAHKANMELVEKKVLQSKSDFKARVSDTLLKFASTRNRIKRKLFSYNHLIPIIGPDGVGKTSLIKSIQEKSDVKVSFFKFKKTFRVSPLYKLTFMLLSKVLQKEVGSTQKPGKTQVDDRFGNNVILNAILLFPLRWIRYIYSKRIVFVDRYFNEYLLINSRWQTEKMGLRRDWKLLLKFIPRTYSIIHLDAPTEVILSRKAELNERGVEAYRELLFKTFLEKPFIVYSYINTDLPLEQCSDLALHICKNKSRESKLK